MRISHAFSTFVLTFACSLPYGQPVQGPIAPAAFPSFELDESGKPDRIDFSLDLKPVSDADLKLSQFQGRRTLLYYFSVKCPHCQISAPYVQRLADELGPKGIASVAIAVKLNSEEEIRGFIRDVGIRMPMMQDDKWSFSKKYGVGTVPVVYLVNEEGKYIRWKSFNSETTPEQIRAILASWPKKKAN